ncbi:MAG: carboxypeptidase regulatory-like domain-containing protein [Thermoanaerobaculia bacterium]
MTTRWILVIALGAALAPVPARAGEVSGKALFKGTPPAAKTVPSEKDASVCGRSHREFPAAEVGVGGGLKDVVVQILGMADGRPPGSVTLDQKKCVFVPGVLVLPKGWTLQITSSDPILHNTHAFWEDGTTAFNLAVPIQGMVLKWKAGKAGRLKVRCDAGHTWMGAAIAVTETPYAAVTKEDGSFTLAGVPPGSYTVEAWHPLLGKSTQKVTVGATTPPVTFEFSGS